MVDVGRRQAVLVSTTLLASWLGMQAVHELGHITGAWITGGRVAKVVLYPLTISRTDLADNPHPLIVVWAGPIFGSLLPLGLWILIRARRVAEAFLLRFFAGFCLLANGLYIGVGSFDRVGDCGQMLRHGSAAWQLWLFGAVTAPGGLLLWHRLGSAFGLGPAKKPVSRRAALTSSAAFVILLLIGFAVDGS